MSVRVPLRPLARVLRARETGESPEAIERENLRRRHEADRDRLRARAESRLLVIAICFCAAFLTVGIKMFSLATSAPVEPGPVASGSTVVNTRADIVDRNGRVLATNLNTFALYAHPHQLLDPEGAARGLAEIFDDLEEEEVLATLTAEGRRFAWLRRYISPEQQERVRDLGEPGLLFGEREMRLYPNGRLAAHVLGGAGFGEQWVNTAEIIGVAGVEAEFDSALRDPARGDAALELSLDLTVQAVVEEVLSGGMTIMNAAGASAVMMDIETGEILALASLPDFDPNARPVPLLEGDQSESPLFNRAVQGVYELGSVFKIFTVANAMSLGLVGPDTLIDTSGPLRVPGFSIRDYRSYGDVQTVRDVVVHSSNIGTARIAEMIGPERQRAFLAELGLLEPTPIEMIEAPTGRPLLPGQWEEVETMTIGYGHGLSTSPVHLAAAYATIAGGGTRVTPTLLRQDGPVEPGPRVVSEEVSRAALAMLRGVVTDGTASAAENSGYAVAGKTGTADKPRPQGGYYEDRTLATFASVFPADDPEYVLVVTLDEPEIEALGETRRTAGWTAVPVAAEIIRRTAPLMGLRPEIESDALVQLSSGSD